MSECTEATMRAWREGLVDGFALAVFVVLAVVACFASMLLAETWRRP